MLLTHLRDEHIDRVYVTRYSSIVTYFTEATDEGGGIVLHVEPGFAIYGPEYERKKDGTREAVLAEAASRLGVPVDQVLDQPYRKLLGCVDPALDSYYHFARRSTRGRYPTR